MKRKRVVCTPAHIGDRPSAHGAPSTRKAPRRRPDNRRRRRAPRRPHEDSVHGRQSVCREVRERIDSSAGRATESSYTSGRVCVRTVQKETLPGLTSGHPASKRRAWRRPLCPYIAPPRPGVRTTRGPELAVHQVVWWVESARPCARAGSVRPTTTADMPALGRGRGRALRTGSRAWEALWKQVGGRASKTGWVAIPASLASARTRASTTYWMPPPTLPGEEGGLSRARSSQPKPAAGERRELRARRA